jgi:uncharacterized protein YndB with AHSA1/START domain
MPRQTSIIASAIIPASPERVWEIACDTSRYPEWVENTLRMIRTDGPARNAMGFRYLGASAGFRGLVTVSSFWVRACRRPACRAG